MIEIDDSLWGSLLGNVHIGIYDTSTKKFYSRGISIRYFQKDLFKTGLYREQALRIFKAYYPKFNSDDDFIICRGTILDGIYAWLLSTGHNKVYRKEIGQPLQGLLEERSARYLHKLGVPRKSGGAHCLSFDDQLAWVREDWTRIKYVKTGWGSWKNRYDKI